MLMRVLNPLGLSCLLLFAACSASRPTAHVIINNDSDRDIPLNLSILNNDKSGSQKTFSSNIKPGLQELSPGKLSRGVYAISAETSNGVVSSTKKVSFDSDRWILINFMHADSLCIQRKYGYVDTFLL